MSTKKTVHDFTRLHHRLRRQPALAPLREDLLAALDAGDLAIRDDDPADVYPRLSAAVVRLIDQAPDLAATLAALYVDERRTMRQAAAVLCVSAGLVCRRKQAALERLARWSGTTPDEVERVLVDLR